MADEHVSMDTEAVNNFMAMLGQNQGKGILAAAHEAHAMVDAFTKAGFSRAEAMDIFKTILAAMAAGTSNTDGGTSI